MAKQTVHPTIKPTDTPGTDTVEEHPAYAQIRVGRVSGTAVLYGSDFYHQHYMTISIMRSKLHRGLSNDRAHAQEELIEVSLSEAQWAQFISSPNTTGVQCTLSRHNGKLVPQIEAPPERTEQFNKELRDHFAVVMKSLKEHRENINATTLSAKAKEKLLSELSRIEMNLTPNLTFVADQFAEHVERTTQFAKVEIDTHLALALQHAGLEKLGAAASPIMLNPGTEED